MSELITSIDEYTSEEITQNGNGMYGGKRHDEICDYLESQGYSETFIIDASVGVWMGIKAEKKVWESKISQLEKENAELKAQLAHVKSEVRPPESDMTYAELLLDEATRHQRTKDKLAHVESEMIAERAISDRLRECAEHVSNPVTRCLSYNWRALGDAITAHRQHIKERKEFDRTSKDQ